MWKTSTSSWQGDGDRASEDKSNKCFRKCDSYRVIVFRGPKKIYRVDVNRRNSVSCVPSHVNRMFVDAERLSLVQ